MQSAKSSSEGLPALAIFECRRNSVAYLNGAMVCVCEGGEDLKNGEKSSVFFVTSLFFICG